MGHLVFTDFVRSLGGEPEDEGLSQLWTALRGVLRSELRQRGLLQASPSFVGIYGWEGWQSAADDAVLPHDRDTDALDELVADCYVYVFVDRLHSLRSQLKVKPNVDGLVFRSIRNFLHDSQRRHDPLGYRVFSVVKRTLEGAVKVSRLHILSGGPRIVNGTVLGFSPVAEAAQARR